MKIHLISSTAGTSGAGLKGNLHYFNRLIEHTLQVSGFQSSFERMSLDLAYPPMYISAGIVGMEVQFNTNYATLPYSNINRRYKSISIKLEAPEFSEHFQKAASLEHSHRFDIEASYKDIPETALAHILIDKYRAALDILQPELKKGDVFDIAAFRRVLSAIKEKISPEYLEMVSKEQTISAQQDMLNKTERKRQERMDRVMAATTLIRDIRMYFSYQLPQRLFYLSRYTDLVLRQLISKDFKCPGYHHLYISIGNTREEALKKTIVAENWFTYGVAVLKEAALIKADPEEQHTLYLHALQEGLLDIAHLDKLSTEKIREAVREAKEIGVLSETLFKAKENNKIVFAISTRTILGGTAEEIFFTIHDKSTGRTARWKFGEENIYVIGGWFGTINVTNKKITIKPRAHMDLVLKGKQKITEIDVEKELADRMKLGA
ncbi:hypothetical protein [Chitinophaga agri]|uniref:Uncharacterized protein n=1 Tax=Chitinophaga agri TaxID=2703787 RepID=A0A6B9ZC08_9BACT|nr:hypothetical protein [Chitinophaga agri]QHS59697.1 hypothetical protein GWR21_08860 [Chitinophaga agri]